MSITVAPAGLQAAATEAYRRAPYPAMVHVRNHPDRFATVARLAGMTPPDIRTARVLEIGTGSGLNLLSLAIAYPQARFTGFDIEAAAIADGNVLRAAAGIENARLEVFDLLDADGRLDGDYDYIIAHGVFAWVPPPVGEALLALIGRHLAPSGVAMVSFNALPGGHLRRALRDLVLRAADGCDDPAERLARARVALEAVVEPRTHDDAARTAYREAARLMLDQSQEVLLHDELGMDWHPRYLHGLLDEARPHGLMFLGDTTIDRLGESFIGEADPTADMQQAIEARACANDAESFCMFRRTLLIRDDTALTRIPSPDVINELFATSGAEEPEPGMFVYGANGVKIPHEGLCAVVRRLAAAWPRRIRVGELGMPLELLAPLVSLYDNNIVGLHTVDTPFAVTPGARPVTSPLVRAMIARGMPHVATLAHAPLHLEPSVAEAVMALDGHQDESRFDAIIAEVEINRDVAFANMVNRALLMPAG